MKFDFDPIKSSGNLRAHGIDFDEAQRLWEGDHVVIPTKNVSGEKRFAILGTLREKIYMAVFTRRNDVIRIISCHRADRKWERVYHAFIKAKS